MTDYDVVFYDAVGAGHYSTGAMGGSEVALRKLSCLLNDKGYKAKIIVAADELGYHDLSCKALVSMRYGKIPVGITAERTIVWAHDASAEAHRHLSADLMSGKATMVCVSGWLARQMPKGWRKTVIPPIVERPTRESPRDMHNFVYASAAIKGLPETLAMWKTVHQAGLRLLVTCPYGDVDEDAIKATPGARWMGRIDPSQVADLIRDSAGLFYVNTFPETFCTLAAVAEAAGARCHVLTRRDAGGLPEAIRSPLLTSNEEKFRVEFRAALQASIEGTELKPSPFLAEPRDLRPETILPYWEQILGLVDGTARLPRAKRKATVCLSMIAKNAGATIERALESAKPFIDSYAILLDDNPADDATAAKIELCLAGIPGTLTRVMPDTDMSRLRNKALRAASGDYALVLDADDWLVAEPWVEFDPTRDSYEVTVEETTGQIYARTVFFRLDRGFRYEYPAHETLVSPPGASAAALHGVLYMRDRSSSSVTKYIADAHALKKIAHRDPRAAFYYAQSLRCAGKNALMAYKRRVEMSGFYEERFISMMEIARIYRGRSALLKAEAWYRRAATDFPRRAVEPLFECARMYRDAKLWGLAYSAASWGCAVNRGPQESLFIDLWAYNVGIYEELALAAYYVGNKEQARDLYEQLLASPNLPLNDRPRIQEGLAWCLGEDPNLVRKPDGTPMKLPEKPEHTRKTCALIARLVFGGEYDAPELPKEARHVIDIGAHIGSFSVWAHAKWPSAAILSFEPNPAAADLCAENTNNNQGLTHVRRKAVTIDPKPALFLHDDWGMNYTRGADDPAVEAWRKGQNGKALLVKAKHPAGLPACDILKIDAEGVEPEILEHYKHLGDVKAVLYEYHSTAHQKTCRSLCEKAGLHLVKHSPYNSNQGTDIWVRLRPPIGPTALSRIDFPIGATAASHV